jgi:hypothetical protein
MATLILNAAGTAIGGPLGGAIGSVIGKQIDNAVFGPGVRQGPRLSELKVQTSRYGNPIPKLFGAVRVAGTVIWSTDLIETRMRQSSGKGRGATDAYIYQASFAVALSARPIRDVGRIWADGQLLRGAAGDLKIETGYRIYKGTEDQTVDPMIAGREGLTSTPAYRGMAYAVFEDMQLGDFGNRIPSLSFEVFADDDDVSAGFVLRALGPIKSDDGPDIGGIAATGDSIRAVAETLSQAMPFSISDESGLAIRFAATAPLAITAQDMGSGAKGPNPQISIDRRASADMPDMMTIAYADSARDYLDGVQSAKRTSSARRANAIELPATLNADAARRLAETRLSRLWAERTRAKVTLPWRALSIKPGSCVTVPGQNGRWRVETIGFEAMMVRLSLVQAVDVDGNPAIVAGDSGKGVEQPDRIHGPTTLRILDLPALNDDPASQPALIVAATGASPGWRRASLLASVDDGVSYSPIGSTALPCAMGVTLNPLGAPGQCELIDDVHMLDVRLVNPDEMLIEADMTALLQGANMAMVGDELLQFGRAEPLGDGQWRLAHLWRGRRGTEWASTAQGAGAPFTLIEPDAFKRIENEWAMPGVRIMAIGVSDTMGVTAIAPLMIGAAMRPLNVVGLAVTIDGGDRIIRWTPRSRAGWQWRDSIATPIGEERESYRVIKRAAGKPEMAIEVSQPNWIYSVTDRQADAAAGAMSVTIEIAQIGTCGLGRPATLLIPTI